MKMAIQHWFWVYNEKQLYFFKFFLLCLFVACKSYKKISYETINALVLAGSNVNEQDSFGITILMQGKQKELHLI